MANACHVSGLWTCSLLICDVADDVIKVMQGTTHRSLAKSIGSLVELDGLQSCCQNLEVYFLFVVTWIYSQSVGRIESVLCILQGYV